LILRRPGFAGAIIVTLAIALGATTAIFSLLHAIVLRPLPFPDADRLVAVEAVVSNHDGRLTLNEYRELSRDSRAFEGWGAYYRSQYNLTGGGPPEALICTIGSSTVFHVLGVKPVLGEIWPTSMDFTRQYLVVLSHRLWRQRFGARPDVIGSPMVMDGATCRIAGVMPEGFDYPIRTDIYRSVTDYNAPHVRHYSVLARIRRDVTLADAQAELDRFAARFARDDPQSNTGVALRATPLRDAYVGRARPFVWLLTAAVGLLLVIACVNIANLLISRAIASTADAAVRLALGANRWHLLRRSLVEAALLTSVGVAGGLVSARWMLNGLTALVRADLPPWFDVSLDMSVLAVAAALAGAIALAIGAGPALHASRTSIETVLRQETGRGAGSPRQQRVRYAMLFGQAAFATMLLFSAGIFIAGLRDLLTIDPGFEPSHLLTLRVDPPFVRYPDIHTTSEFYRRAVESLKAIPGVEDAAANNALPFSGVDLASPRITVEGGSTADRGEEQPFVGIYAVTVYAVASQRRELGIRLALGSSSRAVIWLVVRRSLMPFSTGALVGLAVGVAVSRELASLIGLTTLPDATWVAALPAALIVFAVLASYAPVRWSIRTMAVTDALRSE
jgi:putative ABC transport system permease protein